MLPEPAPTDPIRLDYALTPDDLRDGVAAQQRRGWVRWLVPILAVAVLAAVVEGLVSAEVWEFPTDAAAIVVGLGLVLAAIIGGIAVLLARLALAATYRWQAHLLVRGNPWLSQPIQAMVTDTGIHLRSAAVDATIAWSHHPFYIETDRSFVLLASKGLAATSVVLPKRGLVEAGLSQLRAMLATHVRERP
ncbi:YcxB family protein [Micromonospora sp. NPDC005171]|uniref:YcxB family protein n=1 Tax=Micromonospora sp. NPDC005171 TaxID=3156866 RepID=UPI0033BE780E